MHVGMLGLRKISGDPGLQERVIGLDFLRLSCFYRRFFIRVARTPYEVWKIIISMLVLLVNLINLMVIYEIL